MRVGKALAVIGTGGLIGLAGWRGGSIPFAEQWPLYEALRNTAAIIFAVIGAWMAIAYPERLRMSLRPESEDGARKAMADQRGITSLLTPIIHSTAILGCVLAIGVIAPILKTFLIIVEHAPFWRAVSYATLTTLTLWQLWTVVLTLIPADTVKTVVEAEEEKADRLKTVFRATSRSDTNS